jgi:3-(3-hydroxy-phenyl)propionate hydroxylase
VSTTSPPRADVAIVGFGPTGATLANALGQFGLAVIVFDRELDIVNLPRAVHFDGEVMRIFQSLGLARAIEPFVRASRGMQYFNAAGQLLVQRQAATTPGRHGWLNNYLFHQPALERTLRHGVARFARVDVRLGHEVTAIEQDAGGAIVHTRDGAGATDAWPVRYVVGCDGGRSLVRATIGTEQEDLGLHQPWLVVDIVLERPVPTLPEMTVQYCDTARPTTYVNATGNRRRWEIMLMPGDDPARMTEPATVWKLLERWVTPADATLERGAVYTFHSLIAREWRDRRLLIAGDAAHQTPPFLGQGMCAGIRDAANLAWKLALVAGGRAPDTLLDSYGPEQAAHVRQFIELAVRLGNIIQTTDPTIAAQRDRQFLEGGTMELVNLSPPLGAGVHDGSAPAGEIAPQFRADDGAWSDDAIGCKFGLLVTPSTRDAIDSATRAALARLDVALFDAPSRARDAWLAEHGLAAVLQRPDRYVFGVARDAHALAALLARLEARLATHPDRPPAKAVPAGGDHESFIAETDF